VNELFPPEFLAAIEKLSMDVSSATASVAAGAHLSRAAGSSLDFRDYRQYAPGDDLRRVDWNVYRRTGHVFVRRFDHPTEAPLYILIDTSESMFLESPSRYATAARVAAAMAASGLREHDGVSVVPFSQNPPRPLNRVTHGSRLPEVLQYLSEQKSGGMGSLRAGIESLRRVARRTGVAVIISDFFDEAGVDAMAGALATVPHRVVMVQITQPGDAEPELTDELELVDCESQGATAVFPSPDTLARYRDAYQSHQTQLGLLASRRASVHVRMDASGDTLSQLEKLFPSGILRIAAEVRR
jgi:uncharacterized protein (DUF58 family)